MRLFAPPILPSRLENSQFSEQKGLRLSENAFEDTILGHIDSLHAFARTLTGSMEGAKDLVQETYLKASRSRHLYKDGTNCKAWLFTILKNQFLNTRRRQKWEVSLDAMIADGDFGSVASDDYPAFLPTSFNPTPDLKVDIEKALASLPADLRLIVMLRDQEGLDYREIAELICCPIGTVMSRLARGRERIKQFFLEK